ncbi:BZ3500_MvSof-1268-A1-R1_Chr10-1g02630 [Microbotryum saponariae]|uniref:DNA helicase n=1 Tax=Microbotryum saponariae TaxID=289078 RepID=A0A2X0N2X5_9BASI|nr:BZ3500_MvSof-1268-A1-R1_Chr10-1g02630 [Microbotryum saponariae]SDA06119.1 BZ3501_MvSof-1269-A2-R1_Chr10-1g02231 [Microbotryum saponariae]
MAVSESPVTPTELIQHLLTLATLEHEHEATSTSIVHSSCSLAQLVDAGVAIANLRPVKTTIGLGARTLVHLEINPAHSSQAELQCGEVRNGDWVKLVDASGAASTSQGRGKAKAKLNTSVLSQQEGIEGVVWKVQLDRIVVALGKPPAPGNRSGSGSAANDTNDDIQVPFNTHLLKLSNPPTFHRQRSALQKVLLLLNSHKPLRPLVSILLGLAKPAPPSEPIPPLTYYDDRLNESQKEAIEFSLRGSEHLALIWGPPGTGKTQTLVEIIRQLVARDQRVLVVGGSNLSVDNVLQRLSIPTSSYPNPIPLTRLGHPARVLNTLTPYTLDSQVSSSSASEINADLKDELEHLENRLRNANGKDRIRGSERKKKWEEVRGLRRDYAKREGGVVKEVLGRAKVVLATTHGSVSQVWIRAGGRNLDGYIFDSVIIDEAAQVVEPSSWIPILKGNKLILAGDDCQLPPTIKSLNSKEKGSHPEKKGLKPKSKEGATDGVAGTTTDVQVEKRSSEEPRSTAAEPVKAENLPSPKTEEGAEPISAPRESEFTATSTPSDPEILPTASTEETAPVPADSIPPSPPPPERPQLVPLSLSPDLSLTLFSRLLNLHGPSIRRMLNVQYRFNKTINTFPSQKLYDSRLVPSPLVENCTLLDLFEDKKGKDEDLSEQVVFWDTAGLDMFEREDKESRRNENEAQICAEYVRFLIDQGIKESQMTLISPYNAQVALLAQTLHPEWPTLEIGSIDGMQGRENEVVIISLVRSNQKGEVGFLNDQRRLNVAMTRPKRQLVVVGDSATVKKGSTYLKDWMEWLEENALVKIPE